MASTMFQFVMVSSSLRLPQVASGFLVADEVTLSIPGSQSSEPGEAILLVVGPFHEGRS